MDREKFVQNVKLYSKAKGVSVSEACQQCGLGTSFIPDIKRGRDPSVTRLQTLANYLGVTISELLGERKMPAPENGGGSNGNEIKIVGRDGTFIERELTDEQMSLMKAMLDQLKPVDDENL